MLLNKVFTVPTALLAQVSQSQASIGLTDLLKSIGIGKAVTHPLLETAENILQGDGYIEGALGAIAGTLGGEQTFDYVVIGGGTAGAGIGARLAEGGQSVAIIEAGGYYELEKPVFGTTPAGGLFGVGASPLDTVRTVDWGFTTEPQPHLNGREVSYARGKCLGGSSALNFMVYHRGSTGSYQKWADEVDDQGYTLDNLMPYFQRSVEFTPPKDRRFNNITETYDESAFSSSNPGPVQVGYGNWVTIWATWLEKGFQALGIKETDGFNNGNLLGYHWSQSTVRASDQTRSSSVAYIHAANASSTAGKNLKVFAHTQARRVLFDKSSGRPKATGVEVSALSGLSEYKINARKEVIVSAGAFQSPQILMHSGIGPSDTLSEYGIDQIVSAPGVGQNMEDHILFGPSYEVKFKTLGSALLEFATKGLVEYVTKATGPLTYIADFLGWEKISQLPDYRSKLSQSTLDALDKFPADWPEVEHITVDAYIGNFKFPLLQQPLDGKHYVSIIGAMVAPLSRGNITLKSSDPLHAPAINPNWLSDPVDQELSVQWYRRMREVFRTDPVKSQLVEVGTEKWPGLDIDSDEAILDMIRDSAMTVWHAASTCRMGKSKMNNGVPERVNEMDVIDSQARVFGVDALRVVDASSFPFLPPGHPQSTIYALAEKIADIILKGQE